MSSLGIHDMNQSINGTIPLPILSGEWSEWDHAADVMKTYYLLRICLQPSLTECDLQLKWINDRSYSIKVQWPIYMRQQLMMKDLDTDFPEGHRVYDSMGKNSKALKKKDGDIWLEGVFYFKNPMNCSKMVEKLFRPKIDANNNKGPVLLIQFEEQGKEGATAEFKSPTLELAGLSRGCMMTDRHLRLIWLVVLQIIFLSDCVGAAVPVPNILHCTTTTSQSESQSPLVKSFVN